MSDEPAQHRDLEHRLVRLMEGWAGDAEIAAVYLHGSRARGGARPGSDVDLAVILAVDVSGAARFRKRLELTASAARCLGTDAVDVTIVEDAPAALGHRVLRDGRLLLDRDPRRRVDVVETTLRHYLDAAPLRRELDRALSSRVREGRFAR